MRGLLRMWRERIVIGPRLQANRDPELAQSVTRVIVSATAVLYCATRALAAHAPQYYNLALAISIYFGYSLFHLGWVAARPSDHPLRRILGIFGDQLACTLTLLIGGESALPAFVVYIWVCIGNGIRFGARYMYLATALAALGFAAAAVNTPATLSDNVVVGVLIAIVAIPLFVRRLTWQLERTHEILKRQALELQFDATHDRLTGLANRAVFFDALDRVIGRCDRERTQAAVIYFDVDDFKGINDTYGHLVGDCWLQQAASAIAAQIRKGDLFCRLAGDEFVILTEHAATEEAAVRIADMIQTTLRSLEGVDHHAIRRSASIGIALYPCGEGSETANAVANRADLAMYCSKRKGRGCCTVYRPDCCVMAKETEHREPAATAA